MCSPVTPGFLVPWGFSRVCKGGYAQALRLLWGGQVQSRVSPPSAHCSLFITHVGWLSAAASPRGSPTHSLAHTLQDRGEDGGAEGGKRRGVGEVFQFGKLF